jgi:hypothetical protein
MRRRFLVQGLYVLCVEEVSTRVIVADQAAGLLASVHRPLCELARESYRHLRVMLVAEYVKLVTRTVTQPSSILATGGQTQVCNSGVLRAICSPLASRPPQNRAISKIAIYLAARIDGIPCWVVFRGFGKVQHFVNNSQQEIPPTAQGQTMS